MLPANPNSGIANQSQNLLTDMAKAAELHWLDFSQTRNGEVLLNTEEMSIPDRIKNAFIHGDIMAQTGVIADFIQAGITDFLLPQRRIRWHSVEGFTMEPGQSLPDIIFLERHSTGGLIVHHGEARCLAPEPDLLTQGEAPQPTILWCKDSGPAIPNVVAFMQSSSLLATFIQ